MYNHAPGNYNATRFKKRRDEIASDYKCPLCLAVKGVESGDTLVKPSDIIYTDDKVTVLINSFFIKNNPGHVIVIPNKHFENLYEIPTEYLHQIIDVAQKSAVALKQAYRCEGVTLLQNNEPAGGQHAFHFHLHVFPRYENDELHLNMGNKQLADPKIRAEYAEKLKKVYG